VRRRLPTAGEAKPAPSAAPKKKLSYLDSREWESIEERIAEAETELEARKSSIQDPAVVRDGRLLESAYREMEEAQRKVDQLYARWAELEEKII
jgi:ABC transport system ATP-binding/permease protein